MIIATVRTCERRWKSYQEVVRNFARLNFPFPLRTFQTAECLSHSGVNSRLTARAALAYCNRHLPDTPRSWALFLEDDIILYSELKDLLAALTYWGALGEVDCWYLCNRKTPFEKQFRIGDIV